MRCTLLQKYSIKQMRLKNNNTLIIIIILRFVQQDIFLSSVPSNNFIDLLICNFVFLNRVGLLLREQICINIFKKNCKRHNNP